MTQLGTFNFNLNSYAESQPGGGANLDFIEHAAMTGAQRGHWDALSNDSKLRRRHFARLHLAKHAHAQAVYDGTGGGQGAQEAAYVQDYNAHDPHRGYIKEMVGKWFWGPCQRVLRKT